jgi:ATP-binding cassette subfamily B protein
MKCCDWSSDVCSSDLGQLLAHADADCERSTIAMQPLPFSIGVLVIIAVSMTLLAIVDPVLLAVAIGLFPGLALINKAYTKRVEGPAAATQARVGDVSAVAHESFEAALLVKTLGLENREVARLENKADQLRQERLIVGRLRAGFEPGLDALPSLGTIALLWLGAGRLASGAITTGELVQAMVLFGILAFPFRIVGFLLEELPRAVVANERVQEVLAAPERVIPTTTVALPDGPVDVVLDAVSFAHGPDTVVEEVSVRIAPGEVVALVGATGAGKSTLCSLIAHLIDPDSGSVLIGGVPILCGLPVIRLVFGCGWKQSLRLWGTAAAMQLLVQWRDPQVGWIHLAGPYLFNEAEKDRYILVLPAWQRDLPSLDFRAIQTNGSIVNFSVPNP